LLENGENLRDIQVLPGHESSKTTEICTHIINMDSKKKSNPLDMMMQKYKFTHKYKSEDKENQVSDKAEIDDIENIRIY
jgi:hypothetical protein